MSHISAGGAAGAESPPHPVQGEFVGALLSGSQRKTAFALRLNAEKLVALCGLKSVGFLTLTVGDYFCREHGRQVPQCQNFCPACKSRKMARRMTFRGVTDPAEASRRINNLNRRFLPGVFSRGIVVTERHKSGAIHFHVLAGLISGADIRTGLDFEAVARRDYRSASPALRAVWAELRRVLPGLGFGRHELLPVRKTGECVAAYIAKYIEKNVCNRTAADRHKKLVRYFGWGKSHLKPNEFEWNGRQAQSWRGKARELVALAGLDLPDSTVMPHRHVAEACAIAAGKIRPKMLDGSAVAEKIGPRWAFLISGLMEKFTPANIPFMLWTWPEMNLARKEVGRLVGWQHMVRIEGAKKENFAAEMPEIRWLAANLRRFLRPDRNFQETEKAEKFKNERARLHLLPISKRELSKLRAGRRINLTKN